MILTSGLPVVVIRDDPKIEKDGIVKYVEEASDLGLPPGIFPPELMVAKSFSLEAAERYVFQKASRDREGDILDVVYISDDFNKKMVVLND